MMHTYHPGSSVYKLRVTANERIIPFVWKSLSVLTNPATSALGSAAVHSSLVRFGGIAANTLFERFSLVYMAAAGPLWPSKIFREEGRIIVQVRLATTSVGERNI
jgi:hypothetical protein